MRIPTRQDVEDRSLVREALETQAARLFAERATAVEKKELRQMGRRVDQLYAAHETGPGDRDFLFSANTYHMKLHLRIAECARCPALRDAIEKEQVLIFNWLFDTAVKRHTLGSDFHTQLTDALSKGMPEAAATAMRHHIRRGLKEVVEGLARMGDKRKNVWRPSKVLSKIGISIQRPPLSSSGSRSARSRKGQKLKPGLSRRGSSFRVSLGLFIRSDSSPASHSSTFVPKNAVTHCGGSCCIRSHHCQDKIVGEN